MDKAFELLRDSANYFFSNDKFEDSAVLYEKAGLYFDSPEMKLNAAIAYIKISTKSPNKKKYYLLRALKYLNKLQHWDNHLVNYYKGVVLSLLGDYEKASGEFDKLYENMDSFEEISYALIDLTKGLVGKNFYVYEYLYEEPLVKLYRILSRYSIGREREDLLKNFYGEDDIEMAKAKEIKKIYEEVSSSKEMEGFLWGETARLQATALIYIWGDKKKALKSIKENSKGFFILSQRFPPLTAFILDKISGINFKRKGYPFFIKEIIEQIKEVSKIFGIAGMKVLDRKEILEIIKNASQGTSLEKKVEALIGSKSRKYRNEIFGLSKEILIYYIDKLYRRAVSYYSSKEALSFIKLILEPLEFPKEEKNKILSDFMH